LPGTTAGAFQLSGSAADVVVLGVAFAQSLFVVASTDTLGMVESAGCHSFGVLCFENEQQNENDNWHLSNYFEHCNWGLIAALKPRLGITNPKADEYSVCRNS
jgi:hypothetical protein